MNGVSDPNRLSEDWFREEATETDFYLHRVANVRARAGTQDQEMMILDTMSWGKALVLDGQIQSTVADEFLYHEPLVHPAMVCHADPKSVAILGGGEGATAREVLRWRSVERIVMIDIDETVVSSCRTHLPEMHKGAFDDPRVELVIGDAERWLEETDETFDVLVSDLSDPEEGTPSVRLFTREHFARIASVLVPDGVLAVQAGSVSLNELGTHARIVRTLRDVFPWAQSYVAHVPSFVTPWGFVLASKRDREVPAAEAVDEVLARQGVTGLRMLDGTALQGLFLIPLHIRRAIERAKHPFTLDDLLLDPYDAADGE